MQVLSSPTGVSSTLAVLCHRRLGHHFLTQSSSTLSQPKHHSDYEESCCLGVVLLSFFPAAADLVPPCLGRLLHLLFCPHGKPAKLLSASFSSSPSRHRHCCFLLQQDPEVDDATGFCSATLITATFSSPCCACRDLRPLLPCCSVVSSSNYQLP